MADNFTSLVINDLDSFNFIGGAAQTLNFDVYDSDGSAVDLSSATTSVVFSPYGNYTYAAITLGGTTGSETNRFTATLTGSSTATLAGKYTMQPVIIDFYGEEYRPAQGVVLITGRNATI